MRLLIIPGLLLVAACDAPRGASDVPDPPDILPIVQPSARVGTVDIRTLSGVLPDETNGRVAGIGLFVITPTVAVLGDASRPGLWLQTPLVQARGKGRVRLARKGDGGAWLEVWLLPAPGPISAQSHISAGAMQALGVPLSARVALSVAPPG